jgi:hypothetical protein
VLRRKRFFFLESKYLQIAFFLKLKIFFFEGEYVFSFSFFSGEIIFLVVFSSSFRKMGSSCEFFLVFLLYYYCSILGKLILRNLQYHKIEKKKFKKKKKNPSTLYGFWEVFAECPSISLSVLHFFSLLIDEDGEPTPLPQPHPHPLPVTY